MSLDNSSWVKVPFLTMDTNNLTQMAYLGGITLTEPQLKIYVKYYVPSQTIFIPPNVTKEEVLFIKANVLIKKEATPQDTTIWILTFFTFLHLFSDSLNLLSLF